MTIVNGNSPINRERYLDEVQDEAYSRSSLHGDALVEAEFRLPCVETAALPASGPMPGGGTETLCLSGMWRMKDSEPADPGDPSAPATGWFGPKAADSPGMAERWYAPGCDRSGWLEVQVPTTVQKALVERGELADPLWDTNTIDELEEHGEPKEAPVWFRRTRVERRDWWFATTFEVPARWAGRRLTLRFDGIDYSGTVFVNGRSLGHHKGMFGGPELDVTGLVHAGGSNELVVRIDQAPRSWNGLLKGSPSFGWHYGHLISLGIWKDVWLIAEPDMAIADPYIVTESIEPGKASLLIEYAVRSSLPVLTALAVEGEIRLKGSVESEEGIRFRNEIEAGYGCHRFRARITIEDPKLWWPAGYGEQPLYTLALGGSARSGVQVGSASADFGIRTVEMRPLAASAPETDYRWQFVVNGVPMFIKGANWCWPDPMLEQDEAKYERLLELARRGHVQMLRAWGGGIVEPDFFYRKCDEKGIMVYQEFPLCWGPMDSPYTDLGVIDRQAALTVKRLRNHPSLVMWGGGNENGPHGGADEGLFLIGRRCRGFDPSRPFHRTDPWGGSAHNWNVYHGGEPLEAATLAMPSVFYGEFGIPSMTNLSSVPNYMPEEALKEWPPTEESRGWLAHFHQFSLKDPIKVMRYGAYGPIRDWETYTLYSQTAQGESIRFTGEMQRAGSGTRTAGFWYYKFTDLFPGHSWAVVDYYGTPKLSYYRAMQVCRPRSAFASYVKAEGWKAGERFQAGLYVSNDTPERLELTNVTATLYGSRLSAWDTRRYEGITVESGGTIEIGNIGAELKDLSETRPFLLAVAWRTEAGELISDQWYWFNAQPKPEELLAFERSHTHNDNEYGGELAAEAFRLYAGLPDAPLARLPQTTLEWSLDRQGHAGTIRIANTGGVPAVRVTFDGFPDDWDCFLEDNDFGLYPGETRTIGFEAGAGRSLEGLTAGAWNAPRTAARLR